MIRIEHIERKIESTLPTSVVASTSPSPIVVATLKQYHMLSKSRVMFGSKIHIATLTAKNTIT